MPQPKVSVRIRIQCGEDIAMGKGKAELLQAILDTGSISAAGRQMNLSYRKAWIMVDRMNRCFSSPVVEKAKGGSHGGGAFVTELGKRALYQYRLMQSKAESAIKSDLTEFLQLLADPGA